MATAPDVRVRLTAEGVAEVVNAFKRIQDEAKHAGQNGGSGFKFLSDQLGGLTKLLPTISVGAAVTGLIAMTKHSLELADGLGKLNQKTGISVETLSTLSFAARTADVEQEALNASLVKFTRAMDEYDQGAKNVRDATKNLFKDSKALVGLNQDQRFLKIVDALAKLGPGAKRTGAAMQFFGKSGAELLPLIDDLGSGGFDELRKKAERLGLVIDTDLAKKAQQANDAMTDLKSSAEGMATRFAAGLTPALADAADALVDGISGEGINGFQKLGEWAGKIIKGILSGFIIVGKTIGFVFGEAELAWKHFGDYVKDTSKGVWTAAKGYASSVLTGGHPLLGGAGGDPTLFWGKADYKRMQPGGNAYLDRIKAYIDDINKSLDSLFTGKPDRDKPKPRDTGISSDATAAKEAEKLAERRRKAALELAEAEQDYEARLAAAGLKAQEAAEKEKYEKGLTSLREYYASRIYLAEQQGKAEADALYAKILLLQNTPLGKDELPSEREAQIVKTAADFQAKILENEATINALKAEEAKETEALQQKSLEFEKKIQQAQGERFAAARADIDAQAAALDELLRKQGIGTGERTQRVESFRASGYQQIDFEELQSQANSAMDNLERRRRQIDREVQSGQLFAYEGEQKIMDLESARLPLLQQIADSMKASAITPEQIQAAAEFQDRIDELAVSSNKAALDMAQFKQNVEGATNSDLSNWLSDGISQAESLGDAFRSLAQSIVQSLQQIASQMLATLMIRKLLGFVGMAGTGSAAPSAAGNLNAGTGALTLASGGLVRGPGTGTSDSIAARLSDYEYVIRAAVVKQPGMVDFLNTINFGTPTIRRPRGPRFADGGLVEAHGSADGSRINAGLNIDLNDALVLKRFEGSPEWQRVIVRTIASNKKGIKRVLGG